MRLAIFFGLLLVAKAIAPISPMSEGMWNWFIAFVVFLTVLDIAK